MKKTKYNSISDIPSDQLQTMMKAFFEKKARTPRSAKAFLKSIGVPFDSKGYIDESALVSM